MARRPVFPLVVAISLLIPVLAAAEPAPARSVAVFDIRAKTGIDQAQADVFAELLQGALRNTLGMRVIGRSDVEAMLGLESLKTAMSCEDSACLAQLGGSLGVDEMLVGSLARLGSYLVISLKRVDPTEAKVLGQATRQLKDANEEAIVDAVLPMVGELYDRPDIVPAAPEPAITARKLRVGFSGGVVTDATDPVGALFMGAVLEPLPALQLEIGYDNRNGFYYPTARYWLFQTEHLRAGPTALLQIEQDLRAIGLGLAADVGMQVGILWLGARLDVGLAYDNWAETAIVPASLVAVLGLGI